jgi:spore coat polysaccharide biosynthesis protein SpsF (cytidylyltransferase family)
MKKTVVCIIARTFSKRLPKKVLIKINNKTMIEHIIDRTKKIKNAQSIYICTSIDPEDSILIKIGNKNNIKSYAGSREVVIDRMLKVADLEEADNLVRITGDNIFCDEIFIDKMIELHIEHNADYTRTSFLPLGITAEIFSVKGLKDMYKNLDPHQTEYLTYYVFFSENSLKKLILFPPKKFQKPLFSLTVDTPEDLERTLFIFKQLKMKKNIYLDDILKLNREVKIPYLAIDTNSQIKFPNNQKKKYGEYLRELNQEYKKCIVLNLADDFYEKNKIE